MRTYIFTTRERTFIRECLNGKLSLTDRAVSQIRTRMKANTILNDVALFNQLQALAIKPKSTPKT
jgi:hypothetical protein